MERHWLLLDRCVAAVTAAATMSVPEIAVAKIQAAGSRSLRSPLATSASSAIAPMSPTLLRNERFRTVALSLASRSSARNSESPQNRNGGTATLSLARVKPAISARLAWTAIHKGRAGATAATGGAGARRGPSRGGAREEFRKPAAAPRAPASLSRRASSRRGGQPRKARAAQAWQRGARGRPRRDWVESALVRDWRSLRPLRSQTGGVAVYRFGREWWQTATWLRRSPAGGGAARSARAGRAGFCARGGPRGADDRAVSGRD